VQRTGYENQSRSQFPGHRHLGDRPIRAFLGLGWVGAISTRFLPPRRPARRLERERKRAARSAGGPHVGAAIANARRTSFLEPQRRRRRWPLNDSLPCVLSSHVPVDRPELAFVYGSAQAAMDPGSRRDRCHVFLVGAYPIPGLAGAQAVAGAMYRRNRHESPFTSRRAASIPCGPERQRRHTVRYFHADATLQRRGCWRSIPI